MAPRFYIGRALASSIGQTVNPDYDVIIVGSGPAGVSVALPLLEAGHSVLIVDGGRSPSVAPPSGAFLGNRAQDEAQAKWMIGEDFDVLIRADAVSPKLRIPTQNYVFEGFAANKIVSDDFVAIGSLASGGLSNAWGCGVARLSDAELSAFPCETVDLKTSYQSVAKRMGVSGAADDDLADYFGLDAWADPPLPIDPLQSRLLAQYARSSRSTEFRLGRSRVAALSRDAGERSACDLSGNCMWGCARRALYSASEDLARLRLFPRLDYRPGFLVERIEGGRSTPAVVGQGMRIEAKRILLAAGTLATTRIALQALHYRKPVSLLSCPTAAFLLWSPLHLGRPHTPAFGLGQLSFALQLESGVGAFGSLFNSTGIPVAEFDRFLPMRKRNGIDALRWLMSSCAVGNVFLPGSFTQASLRLGEDETLRVEGQYDAAVGPLMAAAEHKLRRKFLRLGALLLPGAFKLGRPGADIHYAGSLPMRATPRIGETDGDGALWGLSGVHVVDGACLPVLTEKSHTLTIMANADRIGRRLAAQLADEM